MNLFELFVKIGVDDQASKKIETLSKKLGKELQGAAKVAKAAMTVVGTGIVALGKIGLEYNAQIESYTTDFEVMMGNAAAAARKVEELKEMGAKTPFELGDLANATKTLLAFNVSADDSTGVLQQLGDISLGNVQKLESLTRAYGKMNASQKVTLEDINMMIDAGFNPLLLVAENTGETMEEVYDRISKGGVAFEEIKDAISQATSEGGQFYQGMEKASKTTQGLISTLKDVSKSKIGELFSGVSEKIKELLPNVISFIENINTDEIVTGVENLMQAFNDLLPVITGVTAATVAYKTATSIAGIINALRKATEGQTIAQALLNAVMNANPFVLVATLVAGLVAAIITLWNTNEDFRNAVISAWEAIKETASSVFTAVANFFTETIPNAFQSMVTWIQEKISEFVSIGSQILTGIYNGIVNSVQFLYEAAKQIIFTLAEQIIGEENLEKIISVGSDIINSLIEGVSSVLDTLISVGEGVVNKIEEGISNAWSGLVSWFNGLWDSLFGNRTVSVSVQTTHSGSGGNFANGLDYVPYDGFYATLHKGERVLTAAENRAYSGGASNTSGVTIIQNIQSVPQTPVELAAATSAYFEQARWALT